jgi:hypothetical protein
LRTIDKDPLNVEELTEAFQEIVGVSDRSAAILLAAFIDSALSDLIEAELLTSIDEEDAIKPLRDGALFTFFSKIHLGYAITAVRLSEEERRENPLVSVASDEKWTVST